MLAPVVAVVVFLMAKWGRLRVNLIFSIIRVPQGAHGKDLVVHQQKPPLLSWAPQHREIAIHGYFHGPSRHDGLRFWERLIMG